MPKNGIVNPLWQILHALLSLSSSFSLTRILSPSLSLSPSILLSVTQRLRNRAWQTSWESQSTVSMLAERVKQMVWERESERKWERERERERENLILTFGSSQTELGIVWIMGMPAMQTGTVEKNVLQNFAAKFGFRILVRVLCLCLKQATVTQSAFPEDPNTATGVNWVTKMNSKA